MMTDESNCLTTPPPPPTLFRPNPVDWTHLQRTWMQWFSFRFAEWNFYPPIEKDVTFGSEFEQATDQERINLESSPIFQMIETFLRTNNRIPEPCQCKVGKDGKKCNENLTCPRRAKLVECGMACGEKCANRRIQQKEFVKCLKFGSCHNMGKSLITTATINKGSFVIEYIGIVSTGKLQYFDEHAYPIEGVSGIWKAYRHFKYYTKDYDEFFINALKYSNEAHFIHHNTDPNCEIQQWIVEYPNPKDPTKLVAHVRLIVVAKYQIPPGQPITLFFPQNDPSKNPMLVDEEDVKDREVKEHFAMKRNLNIPQSGLSGHAQAEEDLERQRKINPDFVVLGLTSHSPPPYQVEELSSKAEDYDTDDDRPGVDFVNAQLLKSKVETRRKQKTCTKHKRPMQCKYDVNGLKFGDDDYSPCTEQFFSTKDFRAHVKNDHDGKYGCRYYRCGRVYETKDEARLHFMQRHSPNVPSNPNGNDAKLFLPYFYGRFKNWASQRIGEATLVFHPDHPEMLELPPKQRSAAMAKLQDEYEMKQFKKMLKSEGDKLIQREIETILEEARNITEEKKRIDEQERHEKREEKKKMRDAKKQLICDMASDSETTTAIKSGTCDKQGQRKKRHKKKYKNDNESDDTTEDKDYKPGGKFVPAKPRQSRKIGRPE